MQWPESSHLMPTKRKEIYQSGHKIIDHVKPVRAERDRIWRSWRGGNLRFLCEPPGLYKWKWINVCAAFEVLLLWPTWWWNASESHGVQISGHPRCPHTWNHVDVFQWVITTMTGWCAVSKEPPRLGRIKGAMFWSSQQEADVLSPATLPYLLMRGVGRIHGDGSRC